MSKKITFEEVKSTIEKAGCKLLSTEYINNHEKLDVVCSKGHLCHPSFKLFKKGQICRVCGTARMANSKIKYGNLAIAKEIANNNGGECISENYTGTNDYNLQFKCKNGHLWVTCFKSVQQGHWCPECAKGCSTPAKIEQKLLSAKKHALDIGGKCLTLNAYDVKYKWMCKLKHIWEATYSNVVKNKSWCPICSVNASERMCRKALEKLTGYKFEKVRPDWLKYKNKRNLELDGYCTELNLAFEHNGKQHYENIGCFGNLESAQKRDVFKANKCKEHGVKLIVIPALLDYTPVENLVPLLKEQLDKFGIKYSSETIDETTLCLEKYSTVDFDKYLEDAKNIAKANGGECLSKRYSGCKIKLKFKCSCGFEWKTKFSLVKNGAWCPKCNHKTKITIDQVIQSGKNKQILVLSKIYENNYTKLDLECMTCGYQWKASYNQLQNYKCCPECLKQETAKKKIIGIDIYKKVAESFGGKCLSENVSSAHDYLEWECKYGHRWKAKACSVKNSGHWCKQCYLDGIKYQKTEQYKKPKIGIEEYKKAAEEKGGRCLSAALDNGSFSKLEFECSKGHRWFAQAGDIKNTKRWCPHCYNEKRSNIFKQYHKTNKTLTATSENDMV